MPLRARAAAGNAFEGRIHYTNVKVSDVPTENISQMLQLGIAAIGTCVLVEVCALARLHSCTDLPCPCREHGLCSSWRC